MNNKIELKYLSNNSINNGKLFLCLFAIAIYLPMIFTNGLTIILVFYTILNLRRNNFNRILKEKHILFFFFFYIIICVGFFYGISPSGVFRDLEKKLSFILLPVAISVIKLNKQDIKDILAVFFFFGFLVTSVAFGIGLFNFFKSMNFTYISNHELSMNIGLHATYLSMYLLFSLAYPILNLREIKDGKNKNLVIIISIINIFYILLLSVRIVWGILFLILIIWTLYELKHRIKTGLFLCITIICSFLIIFSIPPLKERIKEAVNYNDSYSINEVWGGRGVRLLIWKSCSELIKGKPIKGYGSSREVQKQLNKIYKKSHHGPLLYMMDKNKRVFNSHNQYIQETLKYGILLGGFYVLFLIYGIKYFIKNDNRIGIFFTIIIFGVSLTETILELNKGIVFFTFFFSLLFSFQDMRLVKDKSYIDI